MSDLPTVESLVTWPQWAGLDQAKARNSVQVSILVAGVHILGSSFTAFARIRELIGNGAARTLSSTQTWNAHVISGILHYYVATMAPQKADFQHEIVDMLSST